VRPPEALGDPRHRPPRVAAVEGVGRLDELLLVLGEPPQHGLGDHGLRLAAGLEHLQQAGPAAAALA
jgi:hypothetical protein